MAEIERTRERERPPLKDNPYEREMAYRKDAIERNHVGQVVIKPADREIFISRQGRLQFILTPLNYPDTPLQDWCIFKLSINTRSGKHRHQGGVIIYILKGKGYSIVDGERKDWQAGDLLLLPMKPEGVLHQHFNLDPSQPAEWMGFIYMPINEYLGPDLEQVELAPEFKG